MRPHEASCAGARRPGRGNHDGRVTGTDAETNPSSLSWDTAWRGNLVYLFDMDRGIEVLRLKGGAHGAAKLATVREPRRTGADRLAKVPVSGLTPGSLVCPLFARQ